MKNADINTAKLNRSRQAALRFPTNRSLTMYFMRGSIAFFAGSAVFACLVSMFDLVIPRLIQWTVDAVIGGNLSSMPSWASGLLGQLGGADYLRAHLWLAAALVAAAALGGAVSRYGFRVSNERGAETLMQRMRDELFSHLLALPYAWIGENSTGDIIQRCTSDIDTIRVFVSEQLTQLLQVSIMVVMSLYFMISIHPKLTAAVAVFIPIMVISSLVFYRLIGEEFETVDSEEARLSAIAQENLTGVRVVRTFGREEFEKTRFEKQNRFYTGHWIRLMRVLAGFWVSGNVIATTRNLTVVVFGVVLCVRGELTAGGMIAFLSYNALMSVPIRQIGRIIADMSKMDVSVERLRYIMNAQAEDAGNDTDSEHFVEKSAGTLAETSVEASTETGVESSAETGEMNGHALQPPMDRDIVFSHVKFRYWDGAPEILRDINMTIRAGSTVGILGATGSGKSTLVQLLDRLWELPADGGSITIGGIDIREIDRGWLRSNIGMVLQEPYLFSRTLGENIAIAMKPERKLATEPEGRFSGPAGDPPAEMTEPDGKGPEGRFSGPAGNPPVQAPAPEGHAIDEHALEKPAETAGKAADSAQKMADEGYVDAEIRRAARIASLDGAIEKFTDGYDTFVGERGVTLSGGQKQRAAIAQMLVRHTPVMIFDDSLSSVDAETDARIRRALRENTGDATVILIAHRITTLRDADEIFVLVDGRIAEQGSHDELVAQGGIYSRVYALQTGAEQAS